MNAKGKVELGMKGAVAQTGDWVRDKGAQIGSTHSRDGGRSLAREEVFIF